MSANYKKTENLEKIYDRGTAEVSMKEWLNLKVGRNEGIQSNSAFKKVFSCNFCRRKFYSSQALGGHQNAHRRERGAVKRYQSESIMAMMAFPIYKPMVRSLGFQAHSLVHKPIIEQNQKPVVARFSDANKPSGFPWAELVPEETGSMWPGSFRLDSQQPGQSSESCKVDLNLRL